MNKYFLQARIKIMEEDIKRWKREEASAEHPFTAGYYSGMIVAIEPLLREYERMLNEIEENEKSA